MKTWTPEAKTGLLVVTSAAALAALLVQAGDWSGWHPGVPLYSRFHYVAGIRENAPVRVAGVEAGRVGRIRVLDEKPAVVEVELRVNPSVKLRADSSAAVATLGLMGEKYIEITPGTQGLVLEAGGSMAAEDPVKLEELFKIGQRLAEDVSRMARKIDKMAADLDDTVVDNRPKVDRIVDNLHQSSEYFRDFSQDIRYHPWKLLIKGREKSREEMERERTKTFPPPAPGATTNFGAANRGR